MAKMYALWVEPNLGLQGYICAVIKKKNDFVLAGVCSVEKWDWGSLDSLRKGWVVPQKLVDTLRGEVPPNDWNDNLPALNLGFMKISPEDSGSKTGRWKRIKGDAYRIWENGKNFSWHMNYDKNDAFYPGYAPEAVKKAFPQANWNDLQDYSNLTEDALDSWGIKKRKTSYLDEHQSSNYEQFTLIRFDDEANMKEIDQKWYNSTESASLAKLRRKKENWYFIKQTDLDEQIFKVCKVIPYLLFPNEHALAVTGTGIGEIGNQIAVSKCGKYYSRSEYNGVRWLPEFFQIIDLKK